MSMPMPYVAFIPYTTRELLVMHTLNVRAEKDTGLMKMGVLWMDSIESEDFAKMTREKIDEDFGKWLGKQEPLMLG